MTEGAAERKRDRRLFWAVFALLFVSYAYFGQGGGWNENSRLDLTRAVVHDGTLAIDEYHRNTGDKSRLDGHYYSDKAPGLSFLSIPAYALSLAFRGLFADEHDFVVFAQYLVTALTAGAAGALTSALVFRAARRFGASPRGAVVAAVGHGLGTAVFPFSTMLFGHVVAANLLFAAFLVAWESEGQPSLRRLVAVALLAATAVFVEFPSAPAAAILGLYASGLRVTRRTALFAGAAALPLVALGLYLLFAFGSPVRVGYDVLSDPGSRAEMRAHGLFGVTYPHVGVIAELMLGRYRGLLPYSPLLFLSLPGFLHVLGAMGVTTDVERSRRRAGWLCLAVIAYYLLFVSSYTWWQGGSSFGSRHIIPMLPFFVAPLATVASHRQKLALALLVPSVAVMTVVTAVQPKPSDQIKDPFWRILPAFVRERFGANDVCPVLGQVGKKPHRPFVEGAPYDAFNLGMVLGGHGHKSLVPLYSLWLTAFWALVRATREEAARREGEGQSDGAESGQAPASAEAEK